MSNNLLNDLNNSIEECYAERKRYIRHALISAVFAFTSMCLMGISYRLGADDLIISILRTVILVSAVFSLTSHALASLATWGHNKLVALRKEYLEQIGNPDA